MNYLFNKESNLQGFSRQSGPLFQPLSSLRILYHRAFVRRHQNSQRAIVSSLRRFAWRIPQLRRKGRLQSFPQNLSRHGAGNVIPLDFRNHGFAIYDCIGCLLFFCHRFSTLPSTAWRLEDWDHRFYRRSVPMAPVLSMKTRGG